MNIRSLSLIFSLIPIFQLVAMDPNEQKLPIVKLFDLRKRDINQHLALNQQAIVDDIIAHNVNQTAFDTASLILTAPKFKKLSKKESTVALSLADKIIAKEFSDMEDLDKILDLNLKLKEKTRYVSQFLSQVEYTAYQEFLEATQQEDKAPTQSWSADKALSTCAAATFVGIATIPATIAAITFYPKAPESIKMLLLGGFKTGLIGFSALIPSAIWVTATANDLEKKKYYTQQKNEAQKNYEIIQALNRDLRK